ncbi:MAG: tetratricopeptide repeat protein [Burkholderiaceae bacterium]|nr:tetratricopeptide repeat protein [Burkholderiaceae bacterium]
MSNTEYESLWEQGCALLGERINLDGNPLSSPGFFERRRLRKASTLFQAAAKVEPENAAPLLFLGKIEERLGNVDACIEWLSQANELAPGNPIVALELGGALGRAGRHVESASMMGPVARLHPNDARIHVNLGLSLLMSGQVDRAVQAFENATRIEPEQATNAKLLNLACAVAKGSKAVPKSEREIFESV